MDRLLSKWPLKIAVQYWYNLGRPAKHQIVALEHAYHGDTIGAMSVSADSPFTAAFHSLRIPVLRVSSPAELERVLEEHHDDIAAMIVEPLDSGGGRHDRLLRRCAQAVSGDLPALMMCYSSPTKSYRLRPHGPDVCL